MAQHDINIEAGIIPVLDERGTDALIKRLQTLSKRIKTTEHNAVATEFQNLFGQFVASKVATGRASTTTSARIMAEQAIGIKGGSVHRALTREAADMVSSAFKQGRVIPYASFSEKQISRWTPDLADISSAYNSMVSSYAAFKENPNKENQDDLLKAVLSVNEKLANINKDRRSSIKTFTKIEKDANKIGKEVSALQATRQAQATGTGSFLGALGGKLKDLTDWFVKGLSLQKFIQTANQGLATGESDIANQMMYGQNLDIAAARPLAKFYNIPEEDLLKVQQYALTFRTRMLNNRLNEEEWLALARSGGFGDILRSGEAARHPVATYLQLMQWMRENRGNEAEVMLQLQRFGFNPASLMKMASQEYNIEDYLTDIKKYQEAIVKQKVASTGSRRGRAFFKRIGTEITAAATNLQYGWWSQDAARNLENLTPEEQKIFYENATLENRKVMRGEDKGLFERLILGMVATPLTEHINALNKAWYYGRAGLVEPASTKDVSVTINNQNTMNITGGDSKETAEEVRNQMENWTLMGLSNYLQNKRGI